MKVALSVIVVCVVSSSVCCDRSFLESSPEIAQASNVSAAVAENVLKWKFHDDVESVSYYVRADGLQSFRLWVKIYVKDSGSSKLIIDDLIDSVNQQHGLSVSYRFQEGDPSTIFESPPHIVDWWNLSRNSLPIAWGVAAFELRMADDVENKAIYVFQKD